MKRILMVGPVPPPSGGIAAVMHSILVSRLSQEYEFDVFNKSDLSSPQISGIFERNCLRITRWIKLYIMVARGNYAFVHMQGSVWAFKGVVLYMIIAYMAGAKILLHLHGTNWNWFYGEASMIRRWLTRVGLRLPKRIIVLSKDWRERMTELVPSEKVVVLHNWLSPDHFAVNPSGSEIKKSLSLQSEDFVICSVGTVGLRKGTFEILKAVPEVARLADNVRFVFAGHEETPGEWNEIMRMVESLRIQNWVRFPGEMKRDSVLSLMAMSQLFLLPSFNEGMPIAILEAMKMGIPIISTPVGGIPEMLDNGVSAILIPPGSPQDIAQSVLRLYRDSDLRSRLASGAASTFSEKFDASHGVAHLEKIYCQMIGMKDDSVTLSVSP